MLAQEMRKDVFTIASGQAVHCEKDLFFLEEEGSSEATFTNLKLFFANKISERKKTKKPFWFNKPLETKGNSALKAGNFR